MDGMTNVNTTYAWTRGRAAASACIAGAFAQSVVSNIRGFLVMVGWAVAASVQLVLLHPKSRVPATQPESRRLVNQLFRLIACCPT